MVLGMVTVAYSEEYWYLQWCLLAWCVVGGAAFGSYCWSSYKRLRSDVPERLADSTSIIDAMQLSVMGIEDRYYYVLRLGLFVSAVATMVALLVPK